MRLATEEIRLGIVHADREVRETVLEAFRKSLSDDPTVMPLLIQAVDRYGWEDACFPFYGPHPLAQTSETVEWLIDRLKQPEPAEGNISLWRCWMRFLSRQLGAAPAEILAIHEPKLGEIAGLNTESLEHIVQRVRLASLERDELLRELDEYCEQNAADYELIDFLGDELSRYAESLVRVDPECADRLLELLSGTMLEDAEGDADYWMQAIATEAAGVMRLSGAVPLLLQRLEDDAENEGEWYADLCADALIRIGSDDVVQLIGNRFATMSEHGRIIVSRIFEGLRSERAAHTAVELFAHEQDDFVARCLGEGLLAQFDADTVLPVREFILRGRAGSVLEEPLIRRLVAVSTLMNLPLDALEPWRERAAESSEEALEELLGRLTEDGRLPSAWEAEIDELEREYPFSLGDEDDDELDEYDDDESAEDELDWDDEFGDEVQKPIVRSGAKVGRNDPCPCGSGKKFKKCCMNKPKGPPTIGK
jgi:hypothetical protein